jgi:hypothetical protein
MEMDHGCWFCATSKQPLNFLKNIFSGENPKAIGARDRDGRTGKELPLLLAIQNLINMLGNDIIACTNNFCF